jgi:hypothetical protein
MKLFFLKPDIAKGAAAIAVALVAVAGVVTGREKPALAVVESKAPRTEQAATAFGIDLDKLQRAEAVAPQSDPFAPRSFAPPSRRVAAAAAAPSAPPLPFRYIGKLIANGKTEIFVMRGDELISIAAGRKIDGEYRVDAITESSIAFTYLPLKTRQSIDLAEASG